MFSHVFLIGVGIGLFIASTPPEGEEMGLIGYIGACWGVMLVVINFGPCFAYACA